MIYRELNIAGFLSNRCSKPEEVYSQHIRLSNNFNNLLLLLLLFEFARFRMGKNSVTSIVLAGTCEHQCSRCGVLYDCEKSNSASLWKAHSLS